VTCFEFPERPAAFVRAELLLPSQAVRYDRSAAPRAELFRAGGKELAQVRDLIVNPHVLSPWHEISDAIPARHETPSKKAAVEMTPSLPYRAAFRHRKNSVFRLLPACYMYFSILRKALLIPGLSISRFFAFEGAAVMGNFTVEK